jgi:Spy/CpxP family protein refolding chaperone
VKEWKVIVATLVIFGAGLVTGALVVNLTQRSMRPVGPPRSFASPIQGRFQGAEQRDEYLHRMQVQLNLSPDQRQRIEAILRESQQRSRALWESIEPRMREEVKKTRDRIREHLTPEQRQKFEEMSRARPPMSRRPDDPNWSGEERRDRPPFSMTPGGPPGRRPERPPQEPVPPGDRPPPPPPDGLRPQ